MDIYIYIYKERVALGRMLEPLALSRPLLKVGLWRVHCYYCKYTNK